jgi:hypothetical protein
MGTVGCPISLKMTDTCVARLNAALAAIVAVVCLFWPNYLLPLLLAGDFFMLGFLEIKSPRSVLSKKIASVLKTGKKVNAGPKIFAAKIGFWVSLVIFICAVARWSVAFQIFAVILAIAAGAEALFEFCLGCKIFPHWHKLTAKLKPQK